MENFGLPNPSINWDLPALSETWAKFRQHCDLMFAGPLADKQDGQKVCYLLLWVGERGRDIHSTFKFAEAQAAVAAANGAPAIPAVPAENQNDLEMVYNKFKKYITPKSNVIFARYKFYNKTQGPHESVDNFVTDVKMLAKDCGFTPEIREEMIRDRLVYGTNSNKVRERYINQGADLTAQRAIDIARAYETSQAQLKKMSGEAQIQAVKSSRPHNKNKKHGKGDSGGASSSSDKYHSKKKCDNCGGQAHAKRSDCPAKGSTCHACKKKNHYASVCRSKNVNEIDASEAEGNESSDTDFYIDAIHSEAQGDEAFATLMCEKKPVRLKLDTGAQVNILPKTVFDKLGKHQIKPNKARLHSYGGKKLNTLGVCELHCLYKDIERTIQFHICDVNALLSSA